MSKLGIKRLPQSLRFGGTPLYRGDGKDSAPKEEPLVRMELGVRRVNDQCLELESYANWVKVGGAFTVGFSIVLAMAMYPLMGVVELLLPSSKSPTAGAWVTIVFGPWLIVLMAGLYHLGLQSVLGRNRGTFIRVHRSTRKVYHVAAGKAHLFALDWDRLEVLAGYIPIISQSGYTSRHPLYLIGVDATLEEPAEVCIACGNLGWRDEGKSATQLWGYLQHFMERGPRDLTVPGPLPPRLSRGQTFRKPFRDWYVRLRERLAAPGAWLRSPLTVPLQVAWLVINIFPDALAEVIQYNQPYTSFPKEIDELCGFA